MPFAPARRAWVSAFFIARRKLTRLTSCAASVAPVAQRAAGSEASRHIAIQLEAEQLAHRIARGVGKIEDDDVVANSVFAQNPKRITIVDLDARALERALIEPDQNWMLARKVGDLAVEIDQANVLDFGVTEHLAQPEAIAAAPDEHAPPALGCGHDRVHQELVVAPLV